MALRIVAGFNLAKVGAFGVRVTEDPGGAPSTFQVSLSAGQYAHETMAAVLDGVYTAFSAALKAALDAASAAGGKTWTYTVTYTAATFSYSISASGGNTSLAFSLATVAADGTRLRQALGFSADSSNQATHTSDVRPYYVISATGGAKSNPTDDYEPDEVAQGSWGIDGSYDGIAVTTAIVFHDFDIEYESKAATFSRAAVSAVPWTYQHLWQHVRADEPILVVDDLDSGVHYLRARANWKPVRVSPSWDGAWTMEFRTVLEGRI